VVVTGECDDVPLKPKTRLEWATLQHSCSDPDPKKCMRSCDKLLTNEVPSNPFASNYHQQALWYGGVSRCISTHNLRATLRAGVTRLLDLIDFYMTMQKSSLLAVRLLPAIHLCACLIIAIAKLDWWWVIFFIDLPFSVLIAPLPWYNVHAALAYGSLGTIWWYIVSVLIIKLSLREGSRSAQDKKVGSPMTIWAADLDGSPKLDGLCL